MKDVEVTEINNRMYVVHTVEPSDSIFRLSIMYNIDARLIQAANGLPNDMIHHKKTLNIPMSEKFKFTIKEKMSEEQALGFEENRRA